MQKIDSVEIKNVRGITQKLELPERLLLVGPNGAGKSALVAGMHMAANGYVPDTNPANKQMGYVFGNSSGESMSAEIVRGGHAVERAFKSGGRGISCDVTVDGVKGNKNSAEAMIKLALGTRPILIDDLTFWKQSSTEKRKILLGGIASADQITALMEKEEAARDKKNRLARDRQAAKKTLQSMMESLAGKQTEAQMPMETLKAEQEKLEASVKELDQKIANARATERTRQKMSGLIGELPKIALDLAAIDQKLAELKTKASDCEQQIADHEQNRVKSPICIGQVDVKAAKVIREAIVLCEALLEELELEQDLKALVEITDKLKTVAPDQKAAKKYSDWEKTSLLNQRSLEEVQREIEQALRDRANLQQRQIEASKADQGLNELGAGVDPADVAMQTGMNTRLAELQQQMEPLIEARTLAFEAENARVKVQRIADQETEAKEELAAILSEQAELVAEANEQIVENSREILPYGQIEIEDDGKDMQIFWVMSPGFRVPAHTLSGGQSCLFKACLGHVLAPDATVIVEAAELDDKNLIATMRTLKDSNFQTIMLTCHAPAQMPDDLPEWTMVKVGA